MNKRDKIMIEMTELDHVTDANTGTRRFFRLWLDGSYNGYDHYVANCAFVRANYNDTAKLRRFVIREFTLYLAQENDCVPAYAQKAIVDSLPANTLDALTTELVDDARDLVREEFECA